MTLDKRSNGRRRKTNRSHHYHRRRRRRHNEISIVPIITRKIGCRRITSINEVVKLKPRNKMSKIKI